MTSAQEKLLALIQERKKATTSYTKTVKPGDGRSRWRILPGWKDKEGDPRFYADFGQHWIKDATGQVKVVVVCEDKTFQTPCEVCRVVADGILNSSDDATTKLLEQAKSNARVLVNALHIDGPNPMTPVILELPPSVFNGKKGVGGIIGLFSEWPTLLNLDNGHDIIIERSGSGRDTVYGVSIAGSSKHVDPSVLDKLHDLDKFVNDISEEKRVRAINMVRSVAGVLPAPSVSIATKSLNTLTVQPEPPLAATLAVPAEKKAPQNTGDPMLEELLADLER